MNNARHLCTKYNCLRVQILWPCNKIYIDYHLQLHPINNTYFILVQNLLIDDKVWNIPI